MIFDFLLAAAYALITGPISLIPDLPPMPAEIVSGLSTTNDLLFASVGFLKQLYSPLLFNLLLMLSIALLLFDQVYWFVMYILRKIPFLSIK